MKALGARSAFYVGFLVGTCSLYLLLSQVGFKRNLGSHELETHEKSLRKMIEDENKNWKKERSALFNLNHPHHTGKYTVETKGDVANKNKALIMSKSQTISSETIQTCFVCES